MTAVLKLLSMGSTKSLPVDPALLPGEGTERGLRTTFNAQSKPEVIKGQSKFG